jgi:hypothetical protein
MKSSLFQSVIIAFIMYLPQGMNGQTEQNDFYLKDKVGITLSSFLNNYQALQFNYAKGISESMDLNMELGYIYRAENREDCKGVRVRMQPRFRISSDPSFSRFYISPLFQYRYTNASVENIFSRFDGAYYQQITHTEVNNMFGIGAMIGSFFKLSEHLYINWAFGLGMNFSKISFPDVPSDAKWQAEFEDIFFLSEKAYDYNDEGNYSIPLIISHVNVFYKFD